MRVRCAWEVVAGIIPGQVMPEYTKRFYLTSEEWDSGSDAGIALFSQRQEEANEYSVNLQVDCARGYSCNWTRVDFVWY